MRINKLFADCEVIMSVQRKMSRKKALALSVAISLVFLLILAPGCCSLREWRHAPLSVDDEKTIYVVSHGWHTGIVIAHENIEPELSFLPAYFGDYSGDGAFYELGWGDRGFYQAGEITSGLVLRAVFWPTDSVMHVVSLPVEPRAYFPAAGVVELKISRQGHELLNKALAQSFKRDERGEVIFLQSGLYGDSMFFAGMGGYHIFNTCNTWTAGMLGVAGAPVGSFLTLTADSVMRQAEKAAAEVEAEAEPAGLRP